MQGDQPAEVRSLTQEATGTEGVFQIGVNLHLTEDWFISLKNFQVLSNVQFSILFSIHFKINSQKYNTTPSWWTWLSWSQWKQRPQPSCTIWHCWRWHARFRWDTWVSTSKRPSAEFQSFLWRLWEPQWINIDLARWITQWTNLLKSVSVNASIDDPTKQIGKN